MPNLYIYNADNPPEGTIAKRRALATIVDHMQTVYIPGGLYEDLEQTDQLVQQYEQIRHTDHAQAHQFQHQIIDAILASKLKDQIKAELTHDNMDALSLIHILIIITDGKGNVSIDPDKKPVQELLELGEKVAKISQIETMVIAVSYTHLDVYKRQGLSRSPGRCRERR